MSAPAMEELARVPVDPGSAVVYEHGWQSWSPTYAYRLDERPSRPVSDGRRVGNYRPDRDAPPTRSGGRGCSRVDPGTGDGVHVFGAPSADGPIPSVRAEVDGDTVIVSAGDGQVDSRRRARRRPRTRGRRSRSGATASRRAAGVGAVRHRRRRRGAPGTTTSSTSPQDDIEENLQRHRRPGPRPSRSSRSTTATRPRSATG